MEINKPIIRRAVEVVGALVLAGTLVSCGQTEPPTPEEINEAMEPFVVDGATAANGEPLRCILYSADSSVTSDSKSWFGFACDFQGDARLPGESAPFTTTTEG